jgi:hypothetical protein
LGISQTCTYLIWMLIIGLKFLHINSQPQIFRKDNLGVLPIHISYSVLTMDLDDTLFKVKVAVSRA